MKALYHSAVKEARWLAGAAIQAPKIAMRAPIYVIKAPIALGARAARVNAAAQARLDAMAKDAMGWQAGDARRAPLIAKAGVSMMLAGEAIMAPDVPGVSKPIAVRAVNLLSMLSPMLQAAASLTGAVKPPDPASLALFELKDGLANVAEFSIGSALTTKGLNLLNLAARRSAKAQAALCAPEASGETPSRQRRPSA